MISWWRHISQICKGPDPCRMKFSMSANRKVRYSMEFVSFWSCKKWYGLLKSNPSNWFVKIRSLKFVQRPILAEINHITAILFMTSHVSPQRFSKGLFPLSSTSLPKKFLDPNFSKKNLYFLGYPSRTSSLHVGLWYRIPTKSNCQLQDLDKVQKHWNKSTLVIRAFIYTHESISIGGLNRRLGCIDLCFLVIRILLWCLYWRWWLNIKSRN